MIHDELREKFEKWAKTRESLWLNRHYWGEYMHEETQLSWAAWQASRAALVVELPRAIEPNEDNYNFPDDNDTFNDHFSEYVGATNILRPVREALIKAGVTVK